ncbi:hypothetical protein [Flavobacterium capsici]|uniref:Uncharacterized protein n=1 Tax=Flavobacterium capsici TaxID=3075618 RepID=A0AA96J6J8_9FLAO|nr:MULTISPECIES: hypothetical protein [unclassified Flavobacterium]WNM18883.1 hypothetical protein RN608_12825 [Flavobacterium sp. PMR2A8]WNM22933.1 hypothetical protein RN605_06125 [Flavobacterium sp. PMTSA4]
MKNQIEQLQHQAEILMKTLKEHPQKEATWQVTVNFSGYTNLIGTVSDLMKCCSLLLLTEETSISPLVSNPTIDLANILELAVQLLPNPEAEFLDEARQILSQNNIEIEENHFDFNYSTIKIIPQEK